MSHLRPQHLVSTLCLVRLSSGLLSFKYMTICPKGFFISLFELCLVHLVGDNEGPIQCPQIVEGGLPEESFLSLIVPRLITCLIQSKLNKNCDKGKQECLNCSWPACFDPANQEP